MSKLLTYPKRDLRTKRIGKLVVQSFVEYVVDSKQRRHDMWLCLCDCGNKNIIRGNVLAMGRTKSCGCLLKANYLKMREVCIHRNIKPKGVAARNELISSYRQRSKQKNIEFNLSDDAFFDLTKQDCFYCGIEPSQGHTYIFNGVDRLDSKVGYTEANSVSCCAQCNYAKLDYSLDEFESWINRVFTHRNRKSG